MGRERLLRLLGPVDLLVSGRPVLLPRGRGRSIVVLLALERRRAVDVDRIVEAVWGGRPPRSPKSALHVTVSRLRQAVGPEVIATAPGGYRLGDVAVDLDQFEGAVDVARQTRGGGDVAAAARWYREALAGWRGSPLSGCDPLPFVDAAVRMLEEQRTAALEELIDCELDCGRHDAVVGELVGLVERFPYRERLWGQLMLAMYRAGRQVEALETFARFRACIGSDLGLEPSTSLFELEDRILVRDPTLDPPPSTPERPRPGRRIVLEPGDVVFHQGDTADAIYWVVEGKVAVVREPDITITELGSGRYVGELGPLLGLPRSASVRAVERTEMEVLSIESFRDRVGRS